MNRKITCVLLLTTVILAGIPASFARPPYLTNFSAVYGDGSCGICHIRASGGGPRNDYGTLFESQPDHAADPRAALRAIGPPPAATTPGATGTLTETSAETTGGTKAAPGFGFAASLMILFAWALLARRHIK